MLQNNDSTLAEIIKERDRLRRENIILKAKFKNVPIADDEIIIELEEIELTVRTCNSLKRAGVATVNELARMTVMEL